MARPLRPPTGSTHPPEGPSPVAAPAGEGPRAVPVLDRRRLLAGMGAAVAAGVAAPSLLRLVSDAAPAGAAGAAGAAIDPLGPALRTDDGGTSCVSALTYDTLAGFTALIVPGDDAYSATQGVTVAGPGGVAAGAPQMLALVLDQFLRDPTVVSYLVDHLGGLLGQVPVDGGDLTACHALGSAIEQQGTVPLAPLVAGLVASLALSVDPSSAAGPHASPFANLRWDQKAEVWRRLEQDVPTLLKPAPELLEVPLVSTAVAMAETAGGVLEYAAGILPALAGLFAYAETHAYDREADALTTRPVGWASSRYLEGHDRPVDGWDDLLGYYQGRRQADA